MAESGLGKILANQTEPKQLLLFFFFQKTKKRKMLRYNIKNTLKTNAGFF